MTDMLEELFDIQHNLQTQTYGHDFDTMTIEDQINFIQWNVLALQAEVMEALDEVSWKPWAKGNPRIDRDAFAGEVVDIQKFLFNLMIVIGMRPKELATKFRGKTVVNVNRQASGYDARSTKCACGRALDEPKV